MANVLIRTAALTDADALREVYRRSSLSNEGDRANLLSHPETLEFSDLGIREQRVRAAVLDGRVVGFATLLVTGGDVELEDLFVDPDWMRHGIARQLVLDAVEQAREQGFARIEVLANPHALAFYEKVGFVSDGITETRFGPGHRMHIPVPL